jgi:MtN3 and saliva related transmembrane protein
MNNYTEITGIVAAVITGGSMIPQLVKTIKCKQAEGVSIFMIAVLMAGLALWTVYGIQKHDIPIMATNSFSFVVNAFLIFFGIKYKKVK